MSRMNRRNFMKMLAGVTAAIGLTSKAEEPEYKISCDPGAKSGSKSVKKTIDLKTVPNFVTKQYDLIADLVEEMNNFDKKVPETYIRYSIHCNYTGLAFLNDTDMLDKDSDKFYGGAIQQGYSYILWIPYSEYMRRSSGKLSVLMYVTVRPDLTQDLGLIAQYSTRRNILNKLEDTWTLVTTRCFNVGRDEEGRIIAGLRYGERFCRVAEEIPAGTLVGYDEKRGVPWVKPIKHKDFYKDG